MLNRFEKYTIITIAKYTNYGKSFQIVFQKNFKSLSNNNPYYI